MYGTFNKSIALSQLYKLFSRIGNSFNNQTTHFQNNKNTIMIILFEILIQAKK